MQFAAPTEPCAFCRQQPGGEDQPWNKPCEDSPDRLHWTAGQLHAAGDERVAAVGASLRRAAFELERVAEQIDALPARLQRKLTRQSRLLDPDLIRNEAERARDTLHVYGLLDI